VQVFLIDRGRILDMLEPMNLARGGAEALSRESIIKLGCHPEPGREIAVPRFRFTNSDQQARQLLSRRSSLRQLRLAITLALSIIVLSIGVLSEQPGRLNAGEQPLAGTQVQPGTPDTSSDFVAESHMALKKVHMELVKLNGDITGLSDSGVNYADIRAASEGEIAAQANMVESANAKLRYAQLMREAGEIAVREYQDGIVKEEKVCALAELKLAQEDLARAQLRLEQSRERLAKITRASDGSTTALVNVWRYEYGDVVAQIQAKRAGLAIEQTRSKLRVNEEYDKAVRVKQLQSDVEKLRSDELATRATRELEASKLLKLQRSRDFDKTGVLLTDPRGAHSDAPGPGNPDRRAFASQADSSGNRPSDRRCTPQGSGRSDEPIPGTDRAGSRRGGGSRLGPAKAEHPSSSHPGWC
jgi:hypothetical protein